MNSEMLKTSELDHRNIFTAHFTTAVLENISLIRMILYDPRFQKHYLLGDRLPNGAILSF